MMIGRMIWSTPVLIVPSGIETIYGTRSDRPNKVLIVPSGIETRSVHHRFGIGNIVLIVPSGIETHVGHRTNQAIQEY